MMGAMLGVVLAGWLMAGGILFGFIWAVLVNKSDTDDEVGEDDE